MKPTTLVLLLTGCFLLLETVSSLDCDKKTEIDSHCGSRCELRCEHIGHTTTFLAKCPHVCDPESCKCKGGLYRNADGKCVPPEKCPHECPDDEIMNDCGKRCEPTCTLHAKKIVCPLFCETPSCVCGPNFYRTLSGHCVKLSDCPEEELNAHHEHHHHDQHYRKSKEL